MSLLKETLRIHKRAVPGPSNSWSAWSAWLTENYVELWITKSECQISSVGLVSAIRRDQGALRLHNFKLTQHT